MPTSFTKETKPTATPLTWDTIPSNWEEADFTWDEADEVVFIKKVKPTTSFTKETKV